MLGSDNEYTISAPRKAANISISEIDNSLENDDYISKVVKFRALTQLKNNIRGRLYPVSMMSEEDKRGGTNGLIYKSRSFRRICLQTHENYTPKTLTAYNDRIKWTIVAELLDPWPAPLVLCPDDDARTTLRDRQNILKDAVIYIVKVLSNRLIESDEDGDGEEQNDSSFDRGVTNATAILRCILDDDENYDSMPSKRRKVDKSVVSTAMLQSVVKNEVKIYFLTFNLHKFNKYRHEKTYAPLSFGVVERGDISRYALWPANAREMPALYVGAHEILMGPHEILMGPGSSISCERMNPAALLLINVLRNRFSDGNKENVLLAKREARDWSFEEEEETHSEVEEVVFFGSEEYRFEVQKLFP